MKYFIILLLMTFLSSKSYGEWKQFYQNNIHISYFDTETIKKNNDKVYVEILTNYYNPESDYGILSAISSDVVDCKNSLFKIQLVTLYKKPMGKGKPSNSRNPNLGWHPIYYSKDQFC